MLTLVLVAAAVLQCSAQSAGAGWPVRDALELKQALSLGKNVIQLTSHILISDQLTFPSIKRLSIYVRHVLAGLRARGHQGTAAAAHRCCAAALATVPGNLQRGPRARRDGGRVPGPRGQVSQTPQAPARGLKKRGVVRSVRRSFCAHPCCGGS